MLLRVGNAVTLYPDANVEITGNKSNWAGTDKYTRYPHMDVKIDGTRREFLHRDHLASIRKVSTMATTEDESYLYAAYGESVKESGYTGDTITAIDTAKSYIGERLDPETGLMYLNARYMNPITGRFISPDDWSPIE